MKGISGNFLKIIAFVGCAMLNFAWCGIISNTYVCLALGFLGATSLTVYSFLMCEAMKHTKSITLYMVRLLVLSVAAAFLYFMVYRNIGETFKFSYFLSSPFTVFFTVGTIFIIEKMPEKWMKIAGGVFFCIAALFIGAEWTPYVMILAFIIYFYDGEEQRKYRNFNIILFFAAVAVFELAMYFMSEARPLEYLKIATLSGCILGVPLINKYNGTLFSCENEGRTVSKVRKNIVKYAFYVGYLGILGSIILIKYLLVSKS